MARYIGKVEELRKGVRLREVGTFEQGRGQSEIVGIYFARKGGRGRGHLNGEKSFPPPSQF